MWSEALNQAMRESTSNSCEQEGAGLAVTRQAGENIYSYVSSEKGSVRILRESNRNVFWTGGERKLEGGRDQGYLGICPSSPTLSTQVFQIGTVWSNHIYLSINPVQSWHCLVFQAVLPLQKVTSLLLSSSSPNVVSRLGYFPSVVMFGPVNPLIICEGNSGCDPCFMYLWHTHLL